LTEAEREYLKISMKELGITISDYVNERGMKCSINLSKFYKADYNTDESVIHDEAEAYTKKILREVTSENESILSIIVKKKEATDQTEALVKVVAIIEY
jgi:hypothetical protein